MTGVNGFVIGQSQRQGRVPARCCFVKDLTLYRAANARKGFVKVKGVRPGYVTDIHRNAPEIWSDIGTIMAFLGVKSFV